MILQDEHVYDADIDTRGSYGAVVVESALRPFGMAARPAFLLF
jgi:hypothetical protein